MSLGSTLPLRESCDIDEDMNIGFGIVHYYLVHWLYFITFAEPATPCNDSLTDTFTGTPVDTGTTALCFINIAPLIGNAGDESESILHLPALLSKLFYPDINDTNFLLLIQACELPQMD